MLCSKSAYWEDHAGRAVLDFGADRTVAKLEHVQSLREKRFGLVADLYREKFARDTVGFEPPKCPPSPSALTVSNAMGAATKSQYSQRDEHRARPGQTIPSMTSSARLYRPSGGMI